MKLKQIIACGLLLLGVGATTTSCEDMFTPENNLVTTDLAPQDTLYQVMGIIQRMQKLADRTVLLGEVRADLVEVDPIHASADIQELAANNISLSNVYNQPSDYYAVINNCNIYLANVDSLRMSQGTRRYFEKEICAVKSFRAWCYLELVKNYGLIPLITEPVLTSDAAEEIVQSGRKADMSTVLSYCIDDLEAYSHMNENNELRQSYGRYTYADFSIDKMIIPIRALLAELYLWRGSYNNSQDDYINAIRMYHDYFTFPDEEINVGDDAVKWNKRDFTDLQTKQIIGSSDAAAIIPLDTTAYYGNTTDLRAVFNSQYSNNYYPAVAPSQRVKDISKAQDYCMYRVEVGIPDTIYGPHDGNSYKDKLQEGDLRLYSNYNVQSNFKESQYNSNVNPQKEFITKYSSGNRELANDKKLEYIPIFRNTILYLHFAEALNRAGFPETAYMILNQGLSYHTIMQLNEYEFDELAKIKSYGFTIQEPSAVGSANESKFNGTCLVWPSNVFGVNDKSTGTVTTLGGRKIQIGIHSRGSGDTEYNKYYYLDGPEIEALLLPLPQCPEEPVLPDNATAEDTLQWESAMQVYDDSLSNYIDILEKNEEILKSSDVREKRQARVSELILEEEALEGMFEGQRFYDILRYQMQEKGGSNIGTTITMPEHVETKYGTTSRMVGKPWYLTLPSR